MAKLRGLGDLGVERERAAERIAKKKANDPA